MIKVAIVEDNQQAQEELIQFFNKRKDHYQVVNQSYNGFQIINYVENVQTLPNIVIMDIEMPKMDGISATDYLTLFYPSIKIIVLTQFPNKEVLIDAASCGASAMVLKHKAIPSLGKQANHCLPDALLAVQNNKHFFEPLEFGYGGSPITNCNLEELKIQRIEKRKFIIDKKLSLRQQKLVALMATTSNISQKEFANMFCISLRTLEKQIQETFAKTEVNDKPSLILNMIRRGIVKIANIFPSRSKA